MSERFKEFDEDGGTASPLVFEYMDEFGTSRMVYPGLSKRDYFAAKAMAALISRYGNEVSGYENAANHAYEFADAMLARRGAQNCE